MLEASERVGLENIRVQASEPTWQEAWDVKAVRLQIFPPSPLTDGLHLEFAERFHRMSDFIVCVALDNAVQTRAGSSETGTKLMRTAFSPNNPRLRIHPRFGNQKGFMFLFAGAMDAIRNPRAHHEQANLTREEALEWLIFLSALFHVLDATSQ